MSILSKENLEGYIEYIYTAVNLPEKNKKVPVLAYIATASILNTYFPASGAIQIRQASFSTFGTLQITINI